VIKLCMSGGLVDLHPLSISKYLEVNATSKIMMIIWENLIVDMMKASFLGYAMNIKGYICFNKRLHKLVDCIDVRIDEEAPVKDQHKIRTKSDEEEDKNKEDEEKKISESQEDDESGGEETPRQEESGQQSTSNPSSRITQKNHPESQIIGEKDKGVQTRRRIIKDTEK
jgi:hypothetical protein